ncbi:hypothetical protein CCACVL1_02473 [Corchorus capsularis]|uniref:DUF4283 domain-containing protein n=1 Tax=Corchorus capsularis TaxID=210143 RepID=A0A1R3K8D7_COCAP|nr:hypothetical protein CCACVL1_02473 [Corchorus capsularis]
MAVECLIAERSVNRGAVTMILRNLWPEAEAPIIGEIGQNLFSVTFSSAKLLYDALVENPWAVMGFCFNLKEWQLIEVPVIVSTVFLRVPVAVPQQPPVSMIALNWDCQDGSVVFEERRRVWQKLVNKIDIQDGVSALMGVFNEIAKDLCDECIAMIAFTIWLIWKNRCEYMFKETNMNLLNSTLRIQAIMNDYCRFCDEKNKVKILVKNTEVSQKWAFPPTSWVRVINDSAFNEEDGKTAIGFRHSDKKVELCAFRGKRIQVVSPVQNKDCALQKAT